jgi:hypothetical protein
MCIIISLVSVVLSFGAGFKYAESIYKKQANLFDQREDELFENKQ